MKKSSDIAQIAFIASLVLMFFGGGMTLAYANLQPYPMVSSLLDTAKAAVKMLTLQRPELIEEKRYEGDGVTVNVRGDDATGYVLVQGLFPNGSELRLMDMKGEIVNRWPVDFYELFPDPDHIFPASNVPNTHFNYHTQGMWIQPDGSVLFNIAEKGLVKLDRCGDVVWTLDRMTHHSITPNPDGSFWIPSKGDTRLVSEDLFLPGVTRQTITSKSHHGWYEDQLLLVSKDGEVEAEISLLNAMFVPELEAALHTIALIAPTDPTHINDIEVVTPALAARLDGVETGDLLISVRNLNMLAIVNPGSGELVWHKTGGWWNQHDPDILENGDITIYNNGPPSFHVGDRYPGSNIILLKPDTGEEEIIHPLTEETAFGSLVMGTAQPLPNGNMLITETMFGRLIEASPTGELIWEYVAAYGPKHNALIESAIWYDQDYFQPEALSCPSN